MTILHDLKNIFTALLHPSHTNRPPLGGLCIGRIKMTPSENTRAWEEEKREAGWKRVQVWLPPEAIKWLDALAKVKGGRGKAIEELLR